MINTPKPIQIIDNVAQAHKHKYIIIGLSKKGRYINAGFSHLHWDHALSQYLHLSEEWLTLLRLDSLNSVLLVNNDTTMTPEHLNALGTGLNRKQFEHYSRNDGRCADAWNTNGGCNSIREVTDIEQLTKNPFSSSMFDKYDGRTWGDYLITVTTDLNQCFIYACEGLADGTLTNIWERTTDKHCKKHKDRINTVLLSKKDNKYYDMSHLYIVSGLLHTRQRFDPIHIQRMIGKPPQPPSTPPTIVPTAPKSPKPPPMNNAIHAQAGNTYLSLLAIISITILLCLPFQCAMAYTEDLSKTNSDLPSRELLAFFVPNVCLASQAGHAVSTAKIYPSQGNTVYDGLTLQNKRALGRICRAVTICTESKTRHPIPIVLSTVDSVALTQKQIGVSRND